MGKRISRRQLKEDEILGGLERAYLFVVDHGRAFGIGAISIFAVLIGLVATLEWRDRKAAAASVAFSKAVALFHAPIVGERAEASPPAAKTYPSEADKYREALAAFEKVRSDYPRAEAGRAAAYYVALCHIGLGDAEKAAQALDALKEDDNAVLAGLARLTMASLARDQKQPKMAADLLANKGFAFPPDAALFLRARALEDQGMRSEAIKEYKKIGETYKESAWIAPARERLEEIAPEESSAPARDEKGAQP